MNIGSENVNENFFGLEDEDFGEEINSRMNVTNISSGGSNWGGSGGRMFSSKKPRQKGHMDHFFHSQCRDGCSKLKKWEDESNYHQWCL